MGMLKTWVTIFIFVIFVPKLAQANAAPSAYDMMKPSTYANVELSPSGKYLGFTIRKSGMFCPDRSGGIIDPAKANCKDKNKVHHTLYYVSVFDLDTLESVLTTALPHNFYALWLHWATDDRLLIATKRPTTVGSNYRYLSVGGARVISLDIHTGDSVAFFENQSQIYNENKGSYRLSNILRDDPDHVVMPALRNKDLDLWKVNILTGHGERIAPGHVGTFFWYTTAKGVPVMRFDCVGSKCRKINVYAPEGLSNFGANTDFVVTEDTKWKKIKTFKIKPEENQDDYDFWPVAPGEKEGQFYVLSDEDTDARRAIKIYDLETETFVETVFEHPKHDVAGAMLDLQTGEYAGAWYFEDRLHYKFVDSNSQKHYDALNDYFNNQQNVSLLGFNDKGTKAVAYVRGPDNPGAYYLYDYSKQHVERIFERNLDLGDTLGTTTDILKISVRDGEIITAYHTYPYTGSGPDVPLIVMPHGGPESRDYYDYSSWVQYYATRGYQVLQVNFRGSSGYGRDFAEAGYGEWGGVMQNDLTDSVKFLYDQGLAVAKNACIFGYSYGGYAALYGGATTPELYSCIVGGGGDTDLMAYLRWAKGYYGKRSETYEYWLKSMGDPKEDKEKLKAASPVHLADKIQVPVLLLHGEFDRVVEISHSQNMERALKKAGKSVELVELEDEGHGPWSLETDILFLETIERFLAEHLTGGSPPPPEE